MKELNLPESLENNNCYECGDLLTSENASKWESFVLLNCEEVSVRKCLLCKDIDNRLLSSAIKKLKHKDDDNNKIDVALVPQKTREQCILEQEQEGITMKILRQREIDQLKESDEDCFKIGVDTIN